MYKVNLIYQKIKISLEIQLLQIIKNVKMAIYFKIHRLLTSSMKNQQTRKKNRRKWKQHFLIKKKLMKLIIGYYVEISIRG